jgi:hypothetical protein
VFKALGKECEYFLKKDFFAECRIRALAECPRSSTRQRAAFAEYPRSGTRQRGCICNRPASVTHTLAHSLTRRAPGPAAPPAAAGTASAGTALGH